MRFVRLFGPHDTSAENGNGIGDIVRQPKRLALLTYLAIATSGFVRRDSLLPLLWPDFERVRARAALRKTVHGLRRTLGDALATRGREEVGIQHELLDSDVAAFRRALTAGDDAGALELFRGDLLETFSVVGAPAFDRWLEEARTELRRDAARAAARLSAQERRGSEASIHWAQRGLGFAPHDESALRLLMEAFEDSGDRVGAVRAYERFTSRLRDDLGVEPSAETQRVVYALRTGRGSSRLASDGNYHPVAQPDRLLDTDANAAEWCARGQHHFFQQTETSFDEAERCARKALDLDPHFAPAHSCLASVTAYRFEIQRNPAFLERASGMARRALELDSELFDAYCTLSYIADRSRRHAEAVALAQHAVQLAPEMFIPYIFLGTGLLSWGLDVGRWEKLRVAVDAFAAAVEREPLDSSAYLQFAWLYLHNGQYEAARPLLDRGVGLEENNRGRVRVSGIVVLRGLLHLREGEIEAARDRLAQAIAMHAGSGAIHAPLFASLGHCGLGEAALQTGRHEDSLRHYRDALGGTAAHPGRAGVGYAAIRARCGIAVALRRMLSVREADREFERAMSSLDDPTKVDGQWTPEACHALACVDLARYHATSGARGPMLDLLERAVMKGWGDLPILESDVCFARYARDPGLDGLRARVRGRGALPTPLSPNMPLPPHLSGSESAPDAPGHR